MHVVATDSTVKLVSHTIIISAIILDQSSVPFFRSRHFYFSIPLHYVSNEALSHCRIEQVFYFGADMSPLI